MHVGPMTGLLTARKLSEAVNKSDKSVEIENDCIMSTLDNSTKIQNATEKIHRPIGALAAAAEVAFGLPVAVNVHNTSRENAAIAPLYADRMNSFVIQTEGTRRWKVFEPMEPLRLPIVDADGPIHGNKAVAFHENEVGQMLADELLSASTGDVLYVPRSFPHGMSHDNKSHHAAIHDFEADSGSLTLGVLSESLALTYDKLLRCLAGVGGHCKKALPCKGLDVVVRLAQKRLVLRKTLPLGFMSEALWLSPGYGYQYYSSNIRAQSEEWVDGMLDVIANLSLQLPGEFRNSLPRRSEQKAILFHLHKASRKAVASKTINGNNANDDTRVRLGAEHVSLREFISRRQDLELLHRSFWPERCHIFVEPVRAHNDSRS